MIVYCFLTQAIAFKKLPCRFHKISGVGYTAYTSEQVNRLYFQKFLHMGVDPFDEVAGLCVDTCNRKNALQCSVSKLKEFENNQEDF